MKTAVVTQKSPGILGLKASLLIAVLACFVMVSPAALAHTGNVHNGHPGVPHGKGFGAGFNHVNFNPFTPAAFTPAKNGHIPGIANGVGLARHGYNLDLSSASDSVILGRNMFKGTGSATIDVGGTSKTFTAGQTVTAAEFVAIQEVLGGGGQTITIGSNGAANGGTFSMNQAVSHRVGDLVIPVGVTGLDNFSLNGKLGLHGDLTNFGSIVGLATGNKTHGGIISASDITNSAGGLITTNLPDSLNISNAAKSVDLTLAAQHDINNAGTISSSGALTLATAYGGVSNASGALVKAVNNVNLLVGNGNLTNAGTIKSVNSDVNIATPFLPTDINVNGTGGTIAALNGNINVRDASYAGSNNINLTGGDYFSNQLNLNSGSGDVEINVGQVSGQINTVAGVEHVIAQTDNLTIGQNIISGDPTFVNTAGNITINGALVANEAITVLASGSIFCTGFSYISTANSTGLPGAGTPNTNITLVAGCGADLTTTGASTTGIPIPGTPIGAGQTATLNLAGPGLGAGNISFIGNTFTGPVINTSSTLVGNANDQINGGAVRLVAFGNSATTGQVLFPVSKTASTQIDTSSVFGNGGSVTIVAGQQIVVPSKTPAISVGGINTTANNPSGGNNGNVTIETGTASLTAGTSITWNAIGNVTTGNNLQAPPAPFPGALGNGNIQLTGIINAGTAAVGGGTITLATNGIGTITELGINTIVEGGRLNIFNGTPGIGAGKTGFLTGVSNLWVSTQGSALIKNVGSVTLTTGPGGANPPITFGNNTLLLATFNLTTKPDSTGAGRITIGTTVTGTTVPSTGISTIILNSSENSPGLGGIRRTGGGGSKTLFAQKVLLSDGLLGKGLDDIGTNANPIQVQLPPGANVSIPVVLSSKTQGNDFLRSNGSVKLLASSAGNLNTFSLFTVPDAVGGQITLAGPITTLVGRIGTIRLTSSELNTGGVGGMVGTGILTAQTVLLADDQYIGAADQGLGTGNADIGTFVGLTSAPVFVNALNLGVATSIGNTSGNVNITDTFLGGTNLVNNSTNNDNSAFNSYVLTHLTGGIFTNSDINTTSGAAGNITLKAGGYGIIVNSNILANGTGSTVNLTTAAGGIAMGPGGGVVQTDGAGGGGATGTVTLTALKGGFIGAVGNPLVINTSNLSSLCPGFTNIFNQAGSNQTLTLVSTTCANVFDLSTNRGLTITPAVITPTAIQLIAGAGGGGAAALTFNGNLGSLITNTVTLVNGGTGDIVANNTALLQPAVTAKTSITLTAGGGNIIGSGFNTFIKVNAPLLSANTNTGGTSNEVVNLNSIRITPVTLLNSTSDGNFTLNAAGSLSLSDLITTNGNISVTTSLGLLQTLPNALISVGGPGNATVGNNTLLLENTNVSTGTIVIGAGSVIQTFVGTGSGRIDVSIGPPPVGLPGSAGLIPGSVVFTPAAGAGGPYFFPTQGITTTNPANIQMNSVGGGNILFTIPAARLATAITVNGGANANTPTVITADPPTPAGALTGVSGLTAPALSGTTPVTLNGSAPLQSNTSSANGQTVVQPSVVPSTSSTADSPILFNGLASALATVQTSCSNMVDWSASRAQPWISETELVDGKIPGMLSSDENLGVTPDETAFVEMTDESQVTGNAAKIDGQHLAISVAKNGSGKAMTLNRGTVVFAPRVDTTVKTPFGTVNIDAKSLVVVMAFAKGLAVFNLDDVHAGAVRVSAGGNVLSLTPGRHVVVTNNAVKNFEQINPAQLVAYRGITSHDLGGGLKAFTGDFHVVHAISTVLPLNELVMSHNPQAKKVVEHMIKTFAVVFQMHADQGAYKQVLRAPTTAYLP